MRQQTSVINAIRAHLAEFGIVAPVGRRGVEELLRVVADPSDLIGGSRDYPFFMDRRTCSTGQALLASITRTREPPV